MKVIRLTEGDLHKIIRNTVNKIIKEDEDRVIPEYEKAYRAWADARKPNGNEFLDRDEGNELHQKWIDAMNKEFGKPNPKDKLATARRREAMKKLFARRDREHGWEGERSKEYDDYINSGLEDVSAPAVDFDDIYNQASDFIQENQPQGMSWKAIAKELGLKMPKDKGDFKTMKDAIEEAMADYLN